MFEVSPSGTEKVLYSFNPANGKDGYYPNDGLVLGGGKLYGTTLYSGIHGAGTVFELKHSGIEVVLYSFNPSNGTDGYYPYGGLVLDKNRNLYGTTPFGGVYGEGYGTVYMVTP